jgi:hypothetical protein
MPGLLGVSGGYSMRRFIGIAILVLFLATIFTGIAESHIHPGNSGHHIVLSILFIAAILIHVALNRKAFARYLGVSTAKMS